MSDRKPLDAKSLDKLGKVWAMRGSAHEGERLNAERLAVRILHPFGYGIGDITDLLKHSSQASAEREGERHHSRPGDEEGDATFRAAAREKARQDREREARWEAERNRREQEREAKRQRIIRRYGSEQQALAWNRQEQFIRAAVARWSVFLPLPNERHTGYLDGCSSFELRNHSARVIGAISEAYPLPTTVADAEAEYGNWRQRHEELAILRRECHFRDYQLDLPVELRWQMVTNLLETEIEATTITDVFIRQRHYLSLQQFRPEIDDAVLRDLKRLADAEKMRCVQTGHPAQSSPEVKRTTRQRRAEVEELLSNLDTFNLSDREIARRVGVSPQTVGNIRRRGRPLGQ